MLATKYFDPTYVAGVRTLLDRQTAAFEALPDGDARDALEPHLATDLVLVAETAFVHRQRGMEAKKDSALKALRARAESLLQDGPAPTLAEARAMADAALAEIDARFVEA